jgi:dienelactone hydrolase
MTRATTRRGLTVAGICFVAHFLFSSPDPNGFAQDARTPSHWELLPPTGALPISRTSYHWVDATRDEPNAEAPRTKRELMVHIWYPAQQQTGDTPAAYQPGLPKVRSVIGEETMKQTAGATYEALFSARTHATADGAVSSHSSSYPVLLLTHGLGVNAMAYSMLAEDLASHGYVVVGIDHPYLAFAVPFPDDRVILFAEREWSQTRDSKEDLAFKRASNDLCAADLSFVLNQLVRLNSGEIRSRFQRRLDLARVGAFGHSIGGRIVGRACQLDNRLKAGLCLDGEPEKKKFDERPDGSTIQQPLMNIKPASEIPTDEALARADTTRQQWEERVRQALQAEKDFYESVKGGAYDVIVNTPGIGHGSFSDLSLLESGQSEETMTHRRRAIEISRNFTRAFFDRYVRGQPAALLDNRSKRPKEVALTIYKFGER